MTRGRLPWTRLGLEFITIFTAVLLSFLAEDWREYLGDRRDEADLLEGILRDLEMDTLFFAVGTIPTDSTAAVAGEWLQAQWSRRDLPADSMGWALDGLYRGMAYAPARTEYEAAKSSGRLDLIVDDELRRAINMHFEQTHRILEDVWALNWRFHFEWVSMMRPHVQFSSTFRAPVDLRPGSFNQRVWPEASLGVPWRVLQQDQEVQAVLAQTNTFRRLVLAWQRVYLAEARDLQSQILAALGRSEHKGGGQILAGAR